MEREPTALEIAIIGMQQADPGCMDGRLLNFDGDVYIEARVGLNPLANGYCVRASAKQQAEWNKEP